MLITCSLSESGKYDAEYKYFIVINPGKKIPKGLSHHPELAPSRELYNWAMEHKNEPGWFAHYKEQFCYDMKHRPGLVNALDKLVKLARDHVVMIVCFCTDVDECHRGLIADEMTYRGIAVERH